MHAALVLAVELWLCTERVGAMVELGAVIAENSAATWPPSGIGLPEFSSNEFLPV